ncbi:MAG: hypothetical protein VX777_05010 [Chlamydiota bacterium]|nr:hypothetical protein [Chlamydiota bacterium]
MHRYRLILALNLICNLVFYTGGVFATNTTHVAASLLYHVDSQIRQIDNCDESIISFNDNDVKNLWKELELCLPTKNILELQSLYTHAKMLNQNNHTLESKEKYAEAKKLLYAIWRELCEIEESPTNLIQRKTSPSYNDFSTNPHTSKKYKKKVRPHLMPIDHEIKPKLDAIFCSTRATADANSFEAAGFTTFALQPRSFIRVAGHPSFPNHLLKVYLDTELRKKRGEDGWIWFVRRCKGAEKIRKIIKKRKCKLFTVADKWIYPLPINPSTPIDPSYQQKSEVLVVTNMHLTTKEESLDAWKNMTKDHLKELYSIISYAGGSSYREDNIPYTKSGHFAFIDTEHPYKIPNYENVAEYLSPEMKEYWYKLTRTGYTY